MSIQQLRNLTTLCYIEQDGKYLMLHRVKKENDHAMDDMRYFAATVLGSRERGGFAAHAVSRKRM